MSNPIGREGENVLGVLLHAQDGTLYLVGSYNIESSDTLTDIEYTQRPSDEPVATTIFTTTIWVSGYVKPVSNPGANTDLDATRWG
jgi:hypothetical protein